MKTTVRKLLPPLLLSAALTCQAQGEQANLVYTVLELATPAADNQSLLTTGSGEGEARDLLVLSVTENETRNLSVFEFRNGDFNQGALGQDLAQEIIFADTGRFGDEEILVLFTADQAIHYDPVQGRRIPLISFRSIYNLPFQDRVPVRDFFRDINNDGLDDFLIPGFHGLSAYLQKADGGFSEPVNISSPPRAEMWEEKNVSYRVAPYFIAPLHPGNLPAIVTMDGTRLQLNAGTPEGGFEENPVLLSATPPFEYPSYFEMDEDMQQDQSSFEGRALFDVADYNDDALMDLMVYRAVSSGVFDKTASFELYRGRTGAGGLEFPVEPDTSIVSEGMQFGFEQQDLNGDGQLDMQLISVKLGIGKIIRALLTGSINVNFDFYLMRDGSYSTEPNLRRNIRVDFDLGSGRVSVPLNLTRDLDGDGLVDLIVQTDEDQLEIFMGTGGNEIFSRDSVLYQVDLPDQLDNESALAQSFVSFADINADGVEDILIQHQPQTSREGKIVVMLSDSTIPRKD